MNNIEIQSHFKTKVINVKRSKKERYKLNTIKNSLSIKFSNKTILHWRTDKDIFDLVDKIQPNEKQKKYNRL